MRLRDAVARLAIGLERPFEVRDLPVVGHIPVLNADVMIVQRERDPTCWRVVQRCRVCRSELAIAVETDAAGTIDPAELYAAAFAAYDAHPCQLAATEDGERLYNELERESVRMATRAQALQAADLELAERAEHESVLLAGWAATLLSRLR